MGKPHVIVIPFPTQGLVIPMLELSQLLVTNGIKVTFVNSQVNHHRVIQSLTDSDNIQQLVDMVSIPDGIEPWEDRNNAGKFIETIFRVMPGQLEELIRKINGRHEDKITCIVADLNLGWALEVAEKLGLRKAAFYPASAAVLLVCISFPKLIEEGYIDSNGRILTDQTIRLYPGLPEMKPTNLLWWSFFKDETTRKIIVDYLLIKNSLSRKLAEWIICSSSPELEPVAFFQFPNITPVGPLLASSRLGREVGHFWPEDSACLAWLDQQAPNSVIYVAFGSSTVFDQTQFEELALGLELTNRPFLWVARQDLTLDTNLYPTGFEERVQSRGRMVGWAPQQEVLCHPSVAIFISHCGWNSTIEGIANGIPFLCWPYFADQFINQTYICNEWKIGLGFSKDENGIIRKEEIKDKVDQLLTDKSFKDRALNLQGKAMADVREGCSYKYFNSFIEWLKKQLK